MLVYQHENGIDVAYGNLGGFGHPGMMGLWDLHSSDTGPGEDAASEWLS